ncbi:SPOR domain-containing protein [Paracidovorax wautersii]|uniref:SPOR domain-containing protein n=1 Tax=Paracidovorax wautersii TaxID=1177982 RepID=UPI0031E18E32
MQAHQAYVAQAATAPQKRAAGTIAMPALYRAALGPLNADRYLAFFQRQDDTGRNLPGWNAAAAFFTLGWMVFRQLWMPALVYVAALEGVALVAFALGQHWLSLPRPVLGGLALAVFGAACVLPGLYGDAVMHAEMRKKINRALAASPNLAKAAELLARQAPTRRRLAWVVAVHVLLAAAIVALWLAFPGGTLNAPGTPDTSTATAPGASAAPARPAASAAAPEAAPAASAAVGTASEPESGTAAGTQTPASEPPAAASTPAAPAAAPTAASSAPAAPAPAMAASAAAVAAASAASAPQTTARTPSPAVADRQGASTKRPAASSAAAPAEPPTAKASAPAASAPAAPTATSAAAPRAHHASRPRAPARSTRASTPATATAEASATPPAPVQRRLYINVGLFGDPANARRAMALLQTVDLTGSQAQVRAAGGRMLTRVRVGPFTSASEANDAARRVLSLGLEAAPAQN